MSDETRAAVAPALLDLNAMHRRAAALERAAEWREYERELLRLHCVERELTYADHMKHMGFLYEAATEEGQAQAGRAEKAEDELREQRRLTWEAWEREAALARERDEVRRELARSRLTVDTWEYEANLERARGRHMHRRAQKAEGRATIWERRYHARLESTRSAIEMGHSASAQRWAAVAESEASRLLVDALAIGVHPNILAGMVKALPSPHQGVGADVRQHAARILSEVQAGREAHPLAPVLTALDTGAMLDRTLAREGELREAIEAARAAGLLRTCDTYGCDRLATQGWLCHDAVLYACDEHATEDYREHPYWTPVARRLIAAIGR